ncbi:hypothetical protein IWQ62_001768 [Dispira parvispora]|uniref:rRNA adenine N(6)-methyltransferase n=1 Tax=Dispira parvispora TaxID=1520584 RepID=A0A9W8ARJ7_9FUNG|nr:hypothetical protein IWQ62_001768 [Dispira parvispora]
MSKPLPRLPSVRDLIKLYGLSAKSQLSQNFILDKNITDKIARCADINPAQAAVIEVGPGPGLLTRSLLDLGVQRMVVVEKDARFLPTLHQLADAAGGRLKVIHGDMLRVKHDQLLELLGQTPARSVDQDVRFHLVGNLPFSVATPLLAQWLNHLSQKSGIFANPDTSMTLMFQDEVAQRIVAPVATSPRGRLSIAAQSLCHTHIAYPLSASVFVPQPKVNAAVVGLTPLREPLLKVPFSQLEHVTRFLFSSRRKTLRRTIKNLDPQYLPLIDQCGIDANLRAQDLTTEEFNTFAEVLMQAKVPLPP